MLLSLRMGPNSEQSLEVSPETLSHGREICAILWWEVYDLLKSLPNRHVCMFICIHVHQHTYVYICLYNLVYVRDQLNILM